MAQRRLLSRLCHWHQCKDSFADLVSIQFKFRQTANMTSCMKFHTACNVQQKEGLTGSSFKSVNSFQTYSHSYCSTYEKPVLQLYKSTLPSYPCRSTLLGIHTTPIFNRQPKSTDLTLENDSLMKYLESLVDEFDKISESMAAGGDHHDRGKLRKRYAELSPLITVFNNYKEREIELKECKDFETDVMKAEDHKLSELATEEVILLEEQLAELGDEILSLLIPPEEGDHCDIILEVAAGVGGAEAMLFTEQIFQMYASYAAYNKWNFTVIGRDESELGGLRKASASISGHNVYKYMKYEGGVHRVQRVPKTEKSGRVHTSTMSVAILPQPTEIDIEIKPSDLRVDVFRASGAGGQHVNTTNSAVRIVHIPSGITVESQSNRSQIRNKEVAMQILRSRLYEKELDSQLKEQRARRKLQVGSSARSEKIRTYNFTQDRITDHRISGNTHNIDVFLSGGEDLHDMIEILHELSDKEQLLSLLEEFDSKCKASSK